MTGTCNCGCCDGARTTPEPTFNRPRLNTLRYRIGTHASFLESMQAALTIGRDPALDGLTTRAPDDATIALLDAWATVADVLTFYQERIVNEGYLRTATERRLVLELGRLVGYALRPGVSASTFLAYTLEQGYDVEIPAGSRAQSLPGPGQLPQPFETAAALEARAAWNDLEPRRSRPADITRDHAGDPTAIHLHGTSANLKANDRVLLQFDTSDENAADENAADENEKPPYRRVVAAAEPDAARNYTKVTLQPDAGKRVDSEGRTLTSSSFITMVAALNVEPPLRPASGAQMSRDVNHTFAPTSDVGKRLLAVANPLLKDTLYDAWRSATLTPPPALISVDAMRVKAALFGHNAPLKPIINKQSGAIEGTEEWLLGSTRATIIRLGTGRADTVMKVSRAGLEVGIRRGDRMTSTALTREGERHVGRVEDFDVTAEQRSGQGPLEIVLERKKTATAAAERRRIVLSPRSTDDDKQPDEVAVVIEQDGAADPEQVLQPGQSVTYRSGSRRVTMTHEASAITIVDESPEVSAAEQARLIRTLTLEATYDQILPDSWIVIERIDAGTNRVQWQSRQVETATTMSHTQFGINARVTQLTLKEPWLSDDWQKDQWLAGYGHTLAALRNVTVYGQNDPQTVVEDPIMEPIGGAEIELQGLYDGLQSGRWLFVTGERADLPFTSGVRAAELVMLAGVKQDVERRQTADGSQAADGEPIPGSKTRSTLLLASGLAHRYKRDTVHVLGNVVKATHGETKNEILGSGDGSKPLQRFTLKQPPLTYGAASNASGVASTLEVRVNQVTWHEAQSIVEAGPTDRNYLVRTDDGGQTTIVFGDGRRGARLPTGLENVTAIYRSGIGKPGNVAAGQVSLLVTRPLGVKDVTNPAAATGGADSESRDDARRNVPIALKSLGRLVSVQDYEDFARAFAGIGKAKAVRSSDGQRSVVQLTIAGADDIPIDKNSDLYRALTQALRELGDPQQPVLIEPRDLRLLIISASVSLQPDYHWEFVEPAVRRALLEAFGFKARELGQPVFLSEVIAVIQATAGVACVDVDVLGSVAGPAFEQLDTLGTTLRLKPCVDAGTAPGKPAQLVMLTPEVPDALILRGPKK